MTVLRVALVELKRLTSGVLPVLVLIAMSCIPLLYGALYLYGNWGCLRPCEWHCGCPGG